MRQSSRVLVAVALTLLVVSSIGYYAHATTQYQVRGKYIYDGSKMFSVESQAMLGAVLLHIDQVSNYEFAVVTNNSTMTVEQIITWYNTHGIGKKGLDNGAALFIFPDDKYFIAIGSGNDVFTVTISETRGKPLLQQLKQDPSLAIIGYVKLFSNQLADKFVSDEKNAGLGDLIVNNAYIFALWGFVFVVGGLLISEAALGINKEDLVLPVIGLIIIALIFGGSFIAVSTKNNSSTFDTYGIIDSTHHRTGSHVVCISTGKSTMCTTILDYWNDVTLLGYNLQHYKYTYHSENDGGRGAYGHIYGLVQALMIYIKGGSIVSTGDVHDDSGGKTEGAGLWGTY